MRRADEAATESRRSDHGAGAVRPAPTVAQRALSLQTAIGNRAFAQLVRQQAEPPGSRALALRSTLRGQATKRALARDLVRDEKITEGTFKLNLKTQSNPGAKSGLRGTIEFHPGDAAPDSTRIKLLQAVRLEDLASGKDYVWTGSEAQRNKVQTAVDPSRPGIQPGWFIDSFYGGLTPRSAKADPAVSHYYRDTNPGGSQDGSKAGASRTHASLWDYPGWSQHSRFSFETVAKATDTGHVYGSVAWGFTISDGAKGTVTNEYGSGRDVTLQTTSEALRRFDEYFRNPGASTAPAT